MKNVNDIAPGFTQAFEKTQKNKLVYNNALDEIMSKEMSEILDFLSKRKIKIEEVKIANLLKDCINVLFDDLESYINLDKNRKYTPTQVKRMFKSVHGYLSKTEDIFNSDPIVEGMINLILQQDENEKETTVDKLRSNINDVVELFYELSKILNSDLISIYHAERFTTNQKILFYHASKAQNIFSFIAIFHLCAFSRQVEITSKNGQAEFTAKMLKHINFLFKVKFNSEASLMANSNQILEVFRSKSWEDLHKK